MKKISILIIVIVMILSTGCFGDDSDDNGETEARNYRDDMRMFVESLSSYAKEIDSDFIIIPQNGHELLTEDGEPDGAAAGSYIDAIDGVGREDLFYGYDEDDVSTPESERDWMVDFMDVAEDNGVEVLVTDYCYTESKMDDSYEQNSGKGYISFAADHRELDNIPDYPAEPYNFNFDDVISLSDAKNFLYLLNPDSFSDKTEFLEALQDTDYDLIIMDLFYDETALSSADIESLKVKAGGGSRLVIAYMSIGEAEDYRYYWSSDWEDNPPSWLAGENPDWEGNYKVRYWESGWQEIIYGDDGSYLKKILDAGFDGVYLDIIDAFEYFDS
ncbi:MAG: endo alpha-1,4 polygalactosaminidase [Thermoplasmata archaeon]|nr:MAG: endo alpha-1,4 polygalactosaminidase [Thermoplasmata archaeon]